ncbi:3-keto-disaccharide hydrolase [Flagellimonas sp.]|uniref:3-keto-disaccharide hydrolase n=1 Tax=Flagellimonas sp. TaxID=2058762 RepID=UPI003B5AB6C3
MKKLVLFTALAVTFACKDKPKEEPKEEITQEMETQTEQQESEWTVLFDGTSFDGWHIFSGMEVTDGWKLEDGAMLLKPKHREEGKRFNIVTDKEYTNFVLSVEWMVSSGANSGVMWGVQEGDKYKEPYQTGPEIQVLDNVDHPDAKNGTTHRAGALYDMVSPSQDVVKPVGEWNHYLITINHDTNQGSVVLNDVKIVEFPVNGEAWDTMVANSKFATWEGFGTSRTGKIAFQDHGEPLVIGYRNIKIKEL